MVAHIRDKKARAVPWTKIISKNIVNKSWGGAGDPGRLLSQWTKRMGRHDVKEFVRLLMGIVLIGGYKYCIAWFKIALRLLYVEMVPRQFVYGHFVYDTSSTDISSTDISSTTVYQGTGQLYIQLLFQQIIIFINSNFYLHYESLYRSNFHWHYDNTTYIVSKHCGKTIQCFLSVKNAYFLSIPLLVRKNSLH